MSKIIRVIDNVHMGLGHVGLSNMCKTKFHVDLEKLEINELVMFLNRTKDKLKIIGHQGVVVGYIRMPKGRRMAIEAIQYLPQTFGGSGFNYDAALKESLIRRLVPVRHGKTAISPLQVYRAKERAGLTARQPTN